MAYYGDTTSLKKLNMNVFSGRTDSEVDSIIEVYDGIVKPVLEGHLHAVFSDWLAADDTDRDIVSSIWKLMMTEQLQKSHFATNTTGAQSAYGGDTSEQYTALLQELKAGDIILPGATRLNQGIVGRNSTAQPKWKQERDDEPVTVDSVFQRGLRK